MPSVEPDSLPSLFEPEGFGSGDSISELPEFESDTPGVGEFDQRSLRMVVAYDGTNYRGFSEQPGLRTVAGSLRAVLRRILRTDVFLSVAGRTDRGVHASAQVVSVYFAKGHDVEGIDTDRLARSANMLLGESVGIRRLEKAPAGFDARHSATSRTYRYRLSTVSEADPFDDRFAWRVRWPLDLHLLRQTCPPFLGEHDFTSFGRVPQDVIIERQSGPGRRVTPSMVRVVTAADWRLTRSGPLFEISASSFCHQMVRSLVGTMIDVARGRISAGDLGYILAAKDRSLAAAVAPPQGLCLTRVAYDDGFGDLSLIGPWANQ